MSADSSEHADKEQIGRFRIFRTKNQLQKQKTKLFGNPLSVVLTSLFIFLASQLFAYIILQVLWDISGHALKSSDLEQSSSAQFIFIFLSETFAIYLVWQILKWRHLGLKNIGLGRKPVLGDILKAFIGFGVFYVLLIGVSFLISKFVPGLDTNAKQDVGFKNLTTSATYALAFVGLVILPPIGEEILVRGYLYSGLRTRLSFIVSMLITSTLFAAAHLETGQGTSLLWAAAVNTFVLSLVLVYLREKTGALYAPMMVHALNNLIAFGVYVGIS